MAYLMKVHGLGVYPGFFEVEGSSLPDGNRFNLRPHLCLTLEYYSRWKHVFEDDFQKEAQMTVDEQSRNRIVERMIEGGRWVRTTFEDLRGGEVVRFFDPNVKKPLEQNGATVFMVVSEPREVGDQDNVKVAVVPFKPDTWTEAAEACPYSGNIVVKAHGMDKLIEATGYCVQCQYMRVCLNARYSSEYFRQLRGALGLNDIDN